MQPTDTQRGVCVCSNNYKNKTGCEQRESARDSFIKIVSV